MNFRKLVFIFVVTFMTTLTSTFAHDTNLSDTRELGIYNEIEAKMNADGADKQSALDPFVGLPIRYRIVVDSSADSMGGAKAMMHNNQPIVVVSPRATQMFGNNMMGWVLQHEYAHHDFDHVRNNIHSALTEGQADCRGAQVLSDNNRGYALNDVVSYWSAQGCSYDPRTPLERVTASHPCGTQRAQIVIQCAR